MKGKTTTLYAEPVEKEIHHIIARHATAEDEARAQTSYIGGTLTAGTLTYRITGVMRDDLGRLLLVATLEK